jgi:hypothetical protein
MPKKLMIGAILVVFIAFVALAVAAMAAALWWEGRSERLVTETILVIFVALVALAVAAMAAALWWFRKWQSPPNSTGGRPDNGQTATSEPPTTLVIRVAPGAEREFADRADKFGGLYESLHRACAMARDADECREVLSEWEVRLTNVGGKALQQTWRDAVREITGLSEFGDGEAANDETVFLLGARWAELLSTWGMERDERKTFVLAEGEKKRYRISGTHQVGERVEVELPCWIFKGEVIDRGIARAVATPG